LMTEWMTTYFPTLNPSLITAEDNWLLAVVNNGYDGIPAALEQLIWERARAKDVIEAARMEEEAVAQFASRGFSMPPGVLANRVLQVQQDAANKSSTIARDLAIKQMEIAVDMVKFAIGEITKLRINTANALADFIRAVMTIPTSAADIAKSQTGLYQTLWDSSASYMNAQSTIARLDLEAKKSNQSNWTEIAKLNATFDNQATDRTVNAAIASAQLLANQASAARGAQNTLIGSIESMQTLTQG